jgi:ABC-type multidrug transport system ATPase subunit
MATEEPLPNSSPGELNLQTVEIRGLYKDYGRQRAVADVSLTLRAGQLTALLGENGAGKSTLLGAMATLIRPTRGQVLYDGALAEELNPLQLRRCLGVLSHEPRCYTDLSARENLLFFGRLYGTFADSAALAAAAGRILDDVGLTRAADRPARTLSRGMLQRLAIARTLFSRPQLLLLDEPYTGLDRDGVALLSRLLLAERARGAIVVVISHDLDSLGPLCDQVAVLLHGRLCARADFAPGTCDGAALLRLYQQASATRGAGPKSRPAQAAP